MVAFRSILSAILAPVLLSQSVLGAGLFERDGPSRLQTRQAAVNGDICATLDLELLGITIVRGVCICAEAGVLTPESVARINTQVRANQGVLAPVINLVGGITGAVTRVTSEILPILLEQPTSCVYPDNATPNQCGGCGYVCNDGYFGCGDQCILEGTSCVSGLAAKRDLGSDINAAMCPVGFEACKIPSSTLGAPKFECIHTASDLESCGGCVLPLPGRRLGQDCSAIPNVDSSFCQAGQCVISSCEPGFTSNGTACVSDGSKGRKLTGYWAALQEASHVVLQD